jgi:ribosomal protein L37E
MAESITCPRCGRTSWHPRDIEEGYCGHCHDWTAMDPDPSWVVNWEGGTPDGEVIKVVEPGE